MKYFFGWMVLVFIGFNGHGQLRPLVKKNHLINRTLKEVINHPSMKNASIAFYAVDLNSGEVLSSYQADLALKPASVQKLITTATLLELAGPQFQFRTQLGYTGTIDSANKVLNGSIIIQGGGDPTLGSIYFDSSQNFLFLKDWTDAIVKLGIDSISGQIIGDADYFSDEMIPTTWSWQNIGNYFGAGASGLTIYDNRYTLSITTFNHRGDSTIVTAVEPEIPNLWFENNSFSDTITYDNINIFGTPYEPHRLIKGSLPLNKTDFKVKGSVPDPPLLAAYELQSHLTNIGIKLTDSSSTTRLLRSSVNGKLLNIQQIHEVLSPPLHEIIAKTNINSINLYAEHCLLQSAILLGSMPITDSATKVVTNFWKTRGMDVEGMALYDGSGLSHYNTVTPRQIVFLLSYMKNRSNYFEEFYQSLPIAGVNGTLRKVALGTPAQGNIRAKSGTLDRVKCFAGYVTSAKGREIAFAVMINNFNGTTSQTSKILEKLMVSMASFEK
ncbi:MAG: D-alanyl-D-alanine carboxypeptidase/D-alanyl-D-alanine-endopeptidase [Salinivirgaceae bacterium]|nr:D-alanyl-D-alanine carboxypeptidase/D-alanyl-D-alanine-endopeptidase [Salinivirgaceae bacterium]